jgi:hypothetical protein
VAFAANLLVAAAKLAAGLITVDALATTPFALRQSFGVALIGRG